jgi:tetratricopeptide (TPR) repeat protein
MVQQRSTKNVKELQAAYAKAIDFEKRGLLAEAARAYRLIISKWPDATAYFNQGVVLKKMQLFDEAIQSYQKAIACKPDYAEAYGNIGGIHQQRGAYPEALTAYEKAIQHNGLLAIAHYNKGVVLQKLHRSDDALVAYARALALNPNDVLATTNAASIHLDRLDFAKAIKLCDAAIARQPMAAQAYCNRGVAYLKLRRYDEALADFQKAATLSPDFAEAHAYLGSVHLQKLEFAAALPHYDKAIQLNPHFTEAYYNRGVVLQELRRLEDALRDNDMALALDPGHDLALLNKTVILSELKHKCEARRLQEKRLAANPENAAFNFNLSLLLLSEGDYAAGWRQHEWRRHYHAAAYATYFQKPYWEPGQDVAGKTVFVKWEQGFGDTIQFCRYIRLAKAAGARIIFAVQDPLKRLVASLAEDVDIIGEHEVPESFDIFCFLLSLPYVFRTAVDTVPYPAKYLTADPSAIAHWKCRLQPISGAKIGLVWAGSHHARVVANRRNDAQRSITLQKYAPLLDVPDTVFVSLQKGPQAAQVMALQSPRIHDWTDELSDFAETGALIENLDLVITVDTAVAHLAAALGKPVWILIPFVSCWRWLEDRTDSPWYASVRLFRQTERGQWDDVLAAVRRELEIFMASR